MVENYLDKIHNNVAPEPKSVSNPGFFRRLFGGYSGPAIEIAIAPFVDAANQNHAKEMALLFEGIEGVRVKTLRGKPLINPMTDRQMQLPMACSDATTLLSKHKSDVMIWGDIPEPGTTLYIHFVSRPPADEDPIGAFSPFQALMLPVNFIPSKLGGLLKIAAISSLHPEDHDKQLIRRDLAENLIEEALICIGQLPDDFTTREVAAAHSALANALASFAHLFPGHDLEQRAALSYGQALKGISKNEHPVNWAYLKKNLGMVLHTIGEKGKLDIDSLERAKANYEEALEVFSQSKTPFPWAAIQALLGSVLYRLDVLSDATHSLKPALSAFQSALQVFSKKQMPKLWSNTLNSLGQAAQVLGREAGNPEVVERAVAACRSALEVRKKDTMPLHWAQTQNNLGSALFQLGLMTSENEIMEEALEAFTNARDMYVELNIKNMVRLTNKNIMRTQNRLPDNGTSRVVGDEGEWWQEDDDDMDPPGDQPGDDASPQTEDDLQ